MMDVEEPGSIVYNSQGYPKREGEQECSFFVKNGECTYGAKCKWHHPEMIDPSADYNSKGFPLRPDQQICSFYAKTQECNFGYTCRWHHPEPEEPPEGTTAPAIGANSMGLPRRPGASKCSFFIKSGQCKFSVTCKYDHPESAIKAHMMQPQQQFQPMMHQQFQPMMHQQQQRAMMAAPQGGGPITGYNSKGYPIRPGASMCQFFAKTGECKFGSDCRFDHSEGVMADDGMMMSTNSIGLPVRPGVQLCSFFTKHGSCNYGENCRFDHPEEYVDQPGVPRAQRMMRNDNPRNNSLGFPIRPGQAPCTYYMQHGSCSYGEACKWDHPEGPVGMGMQHGFLKTPTHGIKRPVPY